MSRIATGQIWFVKLPGAAALTCMLIDEVTRKTVVLRKQPDLGGVNLTALASRYARADIQFVERVP